MSKLLDETTMASLASSAWALVLSAVREEEGVVHGHLVAGRNAYIPGIAERVTSCINIIPVQADVPATGSGADLIRSIQEQYASLGESDSNYFSDIIRQCTAWPAGTEIHSVVQHQNIDERPEVHHATQVPQMLWFENPFAVPPYLAILSQVQAGSLHVTIASNSEIITAKHAAKLLEMLCETIAKQPVSS
jgi:non-ribosomal peptide synthetase component F